MGNSKMSERDCERYSEEDVSKRNRREKLEAERDKMIIDSLPPTGVHEVKRKDRDRRRNQIIKKALKK